jgi:hypothetical protein
MREWKAIIIKKDNGFVVKFSGGDFELEKVFEQPESEGNDDSREHYVGMFYEIMDYFGDINNKHREKNIIINYGQD